MLEISLVIVADEDEETAERWSAFVNTRQCLQSAVQAVEKEFEVAGEVAVLLTSNAHMQTLNTDFRNKDKPTNVLSFPDDDPQRLGDIALALETIETEAGTEQKTFEDHLTHLTIHGVLHLLGFDHLTDSDAEEMEALEIELLASLNINNPYKIMEAA